MQALSVISHATLHKMVLLYRQGITTAFEMVYYIFACHCS